MDMYFSNCSEAEFPPYTADGKKQCFGAEWHSVPPIFFSTVMQTTEEELRNNNHYIHFTGNNIKETSI